jgi:hypothetical protein
MDNFTAALILLLLVFLAAGVLYSISPVGAGIAGSVVIVAFLKELIYPSWRDKN